MKQLSIFLLSLVLLTSCCLDIEPTFSEKHPFVVYHIDFYNKDCSEYSTIYYNGNRTKHATIIGKTGSFNIGDTIKLCK